MQKYLTILEKHVQWITLGLAAIFLGYMVWAYVMNPPVTVKLGTGKPVLPGEVNEAIATGPVATIDRGIHRDNKDFLIDVPDLITPWKGVLDGSSTAVVLNPIVPFDPTGISQALPKPPGTSTTVVKALPELPAAVPVALESWRTTVEYDKPGWLPPPGNPTAKAPVITENKMGASMTFTIDMNQMSTAFNKAFGNPDAAADNGGANAPPGAANVPGAFNGGGVQNALLSTMFLQVTLFREELVAPGKWSNRVTVPSLAIHEMQPYPGDTPKPLPAVTYEDWAAKHIDEILSPKFYEVAVGAAPWPVPGAAPAAPVNPQPQNVSLPPTPPVPVPPVDPTGGRRPPGPRPKTPAGGTGTTPPRRAYAPQDPGRPPQAYPPVRPGIPGFGGSGVPGYTPGYGARPPGASPYGGARPPAGVFNPANPQGGIISLQPGAPQVPQQILAHDDTVEPGKTYRYILQYRVLNSLFQTNFPAQDKKWHDLFALVSPESVPTGALTIPERSEIFVRNIQRQSTGNLVHFDVFTWDGTEKVKEVVASSGDSIPGTSWMVVDIRDDSHARDVPFVLLVDDAGKLQRRDGKTDQNNPRYKELQDNVKSSQTARAN